MCLLFGVGLRRSVGASLGRWRGRYAGPGGRRGGVRSVGAGLGLVSGRSLVAVMAVMSLGVTGIGVVSNFVVLPLYFLSGGVFPPEGLPPWTRGLVVPNPVTYGVDWMRAVAPPRRSRFGAPRAEEPRAACRRTITLRPN